MRFAELAKAFILVAVGFSIARALLVHDGIGVVEWLVGVALIATLGVGAVHFARKSLRTAVQRPG
jgi:hypothetical protein